MKVQLLRREQPPEPGAHAPPHVKRSAGAGPGEGPACASVGPAGCRSADCLWETLKLISAS